MTATYRILCLSEATSPITHMNGSSGNVSLVMREPVITPRGVVSVPVLSGNALRHRCVRSPGARHLVHRLGLYGKLDLKQLNYLFHGGNLTDGGGRESTATIASWQRLFPLGRLLGGCLPSQILRGSLLTGRGYLVCQENESTLKALIPADWELPVPLRPAEAFVSDYQYTRGDASKTVPELLPRTSPSDLFGDVPEEAEDLPEKSNLMLFSGQAVTRGALFLHTFVAQHVSELELGALLLALSLWQLEGGSIGGQSARGHGRLHTSLTVLEAPDLDWEAVIGQYEDYLDTHREECVSWLENVFARKAEKPEKGKSKSKGKGKEKPQTEEAGS